MGCPSEILPSKVVLFESLFLEEKKISITMKGRKVTNVTDLFKIEGLFSKVRIRLSNDLGLSSLH